MARNVHYWSYSYILELFQLWIGFTGRFICSRLWGGKSDVIRCKLKSSKEIPYDHRPWPRSHWSEHKQLPHAVYLGRRVVPRSTSSWSAQIWTVIARDKMQCLAIAELRSIAWNAGTASRQCSQLAFPNDKYKIFRIHTLPLDGYQMYAPFR